MEKIKNAPMAEYTSFKVGGPADLLIIVENSEELKEALKQVNEEKKPYLFIGNGSNIIFKDGGYRGTIIKAGKGFSDIKVEGNTITVGCSSLLSSVSRKALEYGLTGLEFASGIPGSIGGAMFMNAGAYGGEMKDVVKNLTLVSKDGKSIRKVGPEDMGFGYRKSILHETGEIVTEVQLELKPGKKEDIKAKMEELNKKRNDKQPVNLPSAGSFFKRPEGYFAGKLIEDSGLKGVSVGGAQVSEKHCGFIVNKGGATAKDIIQLMNLVQDKVMKEFGVMLEPEVKIFGDE